MPATNVTSGRFSAPRRIKTYLKSTMLRERLNSLMNLAVHKVSTDRLNLLQVLSNLFLGKKCKLSVRYLPVNAQDFTATGSTSQFSSYHCFTFRII